MTLILTHSDVEQLLDRDEVLAAVERAHVEIVENAASNPTPPAMTLGETAFIPMVASSTTARAASVKTLADIPANRSRGLPTQRSTIVVTSADTGECEALIDGRHITATRTAAASAVATKYLARKDSATLGLVGAGALAVEHVRAIAKVRQLRTVLVWSRSTVRVEAFRDRISDLGLTVKPVESPEVVIRSADIVCTLTPSRQPIARGSWFGDGLHVNAVGAPPRADHREVDSEAMRRSRVVVDSTATTLLKSGDALLAIADGTITAEDVSTELGDVIAGGAVGRSSDQAITLFNSVGIGLQDLAAARLVIDRARTHSVGIYVDLSA